MNMSDLLSVIKMDLGFHMFTLPLENPDQALVDVIEMKTIRTFSQYFPHKVDHIYELTTLEKTRETFKETTFILPSVYGDNTLMAITGVEPWNEMYNGSYFGGSPLVTNSINLYGDTMMAQAGYDLLSTVSPPFSYKFIPPNKLTIFNTSSFTNKVKIFMAYRHPNNLVTIRPTMEEAFTELARLDVKIFLFNSLKHYDNIQTAYGSINLRIEDWSGAESERKDLLSRWEDEFHLDLDAMVVV